MHTLYKDTPFAPSTAGRIVFFECTARHRFAKMKAGLEEMRDGAYFKDAAAVVFADFRHRGEERRLLDGFLHEFAQTLQCPVFSGYPYGHCKKSYLIDFFRELEISVDGTVIAR
jgi:muramoyltetrapeptide carboxypeptidase LdcA involved in peptidoglycan recycling